MSMLLPQCIPAVLVTADHVADWLRGYSSGDELGEESLTSGMLDNPREDSQLICLSVLLLRGENQTRCAEVL